MTNSPLVSVCIPAYNAAKTISETIDTILSQTYSPIEIIVSDNNSTDNTLQVIEQYGKHVRSIRCPIRILNHNDSLEVSLSALNNDHRVFLPHAKGEFLTVYHADDVYDGQIIQKEVEFLTSHPDCGAVFTMHRFMDEHGRILIRPPIRLHPEIRNKNEYDLGELLNAMLMHGLVLPTPSVMARRSLWEKIGYSNPAFAHAADCELWIRMAAHSKIGIKDEILFSRRIGKSQDSYRWYKNYRHKESPILKLFESYITRDDIRPFMKEQSLVSLKRGWFRDYVRLALNYFEDNEIQGGTEYLKQAYSLRKELGPLPDRNSKIWNCFFRLLMFAPTPFIRCQLASMINKLYRRKQFGSSSL
jgi:glycosyltransferase involved in cell wall biosynthesis